ncbi:SAM-dependent methyltransferase [Streptomyces sp. YIM B13518]|uniref:SAM-dependent methyltransferase n=1 Tax=Streptomyces sp. YIM B13518 TaxID=3366316 RepID=UPI00369DDAA2
MPHGFRNLPHRQRDPRRTDGRRGDEERPARRRRSARRGRWRTDEEIASLLDGLEILTPGLVPAPLWRPDPVGGNPWGTGGAERELTVREHLIAAGPARKA